MTGPQVAGQPAADRLMESVAYFARAYGVAPPDLRQVAVVLRAQADHTAIQAALRWRPDPDSPSPAATSVGRWLHDTADQLTQG